MIPFRYFAAASVAAHALLLGVKDFGWRQEAALRFAPPESTVAVRFAEVTPPPLGNAEEKAAPAEQTPTPEAASALPVDAPNAPPDPATEEKTAAERPATPAKKATAFPKKTEAPRKKPSPRPKVKPAPPPPLGGATAEPRSARQPAPPSPPTPEPKKELVLGHSGAPSYARFIPPDYPERARRRNLEGKVLLRVLISAEGRAKAVEVLESSHPEFTLAARASARRSRYVPMKRLGQPEEAWVLIPFHFKLR